MININIRFFIFFSSFLQFLSVALGLRRSAVVAGLFLHNPPGDTADRTRAGTDCKARQDAAARDLLQCPSSSVPSLLAVIATQISRTSSTVSSTPWAAKARCSFSAAPAWRGSR